MTPDEIRVALEQAREYRERADAYINGVHVPGGIRMPGADLARALLRALAALEESRRECEALRTALRDIRQCLPSAEWVDLVDAVLERVGVERNPGRVAPKCEDRRVTLTINACLLDPTLLEPGTPVCVESWFDGAGMVHALSGEIVSIEEAAS